VVTSRTIKQIQITLPVHELYLGEAMPLEVVYANRGDRPLSFREPARTWEVMLAVTGPGGEAEQVSFGRLFYTEQGDRSSVSIEPAQQIALAPGGEHRFHEDLWARWPELWQPGRTMLYVLDQSDDAHTLQSNAISLEISFSAASVLPLLALARSPDTRKGARIVAAEWLGRLHPLDPFITAPTGDEVAANGRTLDAWEHWWTQSREQADVAATFAAINHQPMR